MLSQMRAKASLLLEEISGDYRVMYMTRITHSLVASLFNLQTLSFVLFGLATNMLKRRSCRFFTLSRVLRPCGTREALLSNLC